MFPFIRSQNAIIVYVDGKQYTMSRDSANYPLVERALANGDADGVLTAFDLKGQITKASNGKVEVRDGNLYYGQHVIHNTLTQRILNAIDRGLYVTPMLNFVENLMQNPSSTSINELYLFLEACSLPITEDGYFLAYKKVRYDYTDIHSGTVSNHIGAKPEMLRGLVDDNRDNTCSQGLHFCSFNYLSQFGSSDPEQCRVVVLKINPADVVSIPSDYNNAKGRCWTYEVIQEIDWTAGETIPDNVVVSDNFDEDGDEDWDDEDEDFDEGEDEDLDEEDELSLEGALEAVYEEGVLNPTAVFSDDLFSNFEKLCEKYLRRFWAVDGDVEWNRLVRDLYVLMRMEWDDETPTKTSVAEIVGTSPRSIDRILQKWNYVDNLVDEALTEDY